MNNDVPIVIVLGNRRDFSDSFLPYLYPLAIVLFIGTLLSYLFCFFIFQQKEPVPISLTGSSSLAKSDFEAIHRGILNLRRQQVQQLPNLGEELSLRALNTRPDAKQMEEEGGQPRLLFTFRGNPIPILARSGQPLYLSWEKAAASREDWNGPPAPISISNLPTPWKIEPLVVENQAFVAASTTNETLEILIRKTEEKSATCEKVNSSSWLQSLKTGRFWIADRFLSAYSKTTENPLKMGFGKMSTENVLALSPGQYLFFVSGEWQQGNLEQAKKRPLAQVIGQIDSMLALHVWDESGFYCEVVSIPLLSSGMYAFTKMETLFSALKARNSSEVSSVMGKRRVVLKPGDWWIKTNIGWRRLKKRSEIEDYLSFRLLGELFVIDGLEMFQGKTVIKGHQFDPLRQHMQPFVLPIAEAPGRASKTYPSATVNSPPVHEKRPQRPHPVLRELKEKTSS